MARAQSSAETEQRILGAATKLLAERYYDEVSLEQVAEAAGVSAKTVVRRFGTKEALAARFLEAAGRHNAAERDAVPAGDVDAALRMILETYELFGDAAMRSLSLEGRIPMVTAIAEKGRELHTAWVERVFEPLVRSARAERQADLALLLVATDVYTWKLLRRDRGFSPAQTARAVRRLVDAILHPPSQQ
jgi:AcrR family transcriptional regulator